MAKLKVGDFEQYINQFDKVEFIPSYGNFGGSWRNGVVVSIDKMRGQLLIRHSELKVTEWLPIYNLKQQVVRIKLLPGQRTIVIPKDLPKLSAREKRFLKLIEKLRNVLNDVKEGMEYEDYQGTCGCVPGAAKNPKLCGCLQRHLTQLNGMQTVINEADITIKEKQ